MTPPAKVHLLVDLENVQPSPSDVESWLKDEGQAWIFYGPHQLKRKADFELNSPRSTLIPISRSGSNSLDFHLVFYLGYLAAKHPTGRFVVLAKDTGYDPPIAHARTLAFSIQRMKDLPARATKTATPNATATRVVPSEHPAPAPITERKQSEPVGVQKKKATSSAKLAGHQAPAAKVKLSPQSAPAAKKRSSKKPLIAMYRDLLKDLSAANRPKSLSALKHHIQTKFGTSPVPEKVQGLIDRLLTSDVIHLANNKLGYGPPKIQGRPGTRNDGKTADSVTCVHLIEGPQPLPRVFDSSFQARPDSHTHTDAGPVGGKHHAWRTPADAKQPASASAGNSKDKHARLSA